MMNPKNIRKDPLLGDHASVDLDADAKPAVHGDPSRKVKRGFWMLVNIGLWLLLGFILLSIIFRLGGVAGVPIVGGILFFVALGYWLAYSNFKKRE